MKAQKKGAFSVSQKALLSKRGQIALFVIIAIMLVGAVLVLLIAKPKIPFITPEKIDVESYIQKCATDSMTAAADKIMSQGGFLDLNNTEKIMYKGSYVAYLCYTTEFYRPCVNQAPLLENQIAKQINDYSKPLMEKCILKLKANLENKGYTASIGALNTSVTLFPKSIIMNISLPITATKGDETLAYEGFDSKISSPAYEFASLANEIINSEITYGDFNDINYIMFHPDMMIYKDKINFDKFYTLEMNGKLFVFSVRSNVIPEGWRMK